MSYATDKTVTLPAAAALIYENAEFAGWYETADFTSPILTGWVAGEQTGNKTLYARWADRVADANTIENVITNLPDSGSYTIAVTGAITDSTISAIRSALESISTAKIHLDLSGTTGLKTIGYQAFSGCSSLTSVIIPAGVTSIEYEAFRACTSLTSVNIPASVTSIGDYAFWGCDSLTSVSIPDSVTSIGRFAFFNCSSLTSVSIPAGVTSIGECAFSGCSSLTSVNIPASVPSIGKGAFYECSSLTSVSIPAGVTSIGEAAFEGCSSLTSVSIPASVTSIGYNTFLGCTSLTQFTVASANANYTASTDGTMLLSKDGPTLIACPSASGAVNIPDSVTSIGEMAFYECSSLTSVSIPASVRSIGKSAFFYCSSLTSVIIPAGVTSIGSYAFVCCSSLTSVTFEDADTWYYTERDNYTDGTAIDVTNTTTNATYLKSTYPYYWYKE